MNKPIIIIGAGWAGQTMASVLLKDKSNQIIGFVDDNISAQTIVTSENNQKYSLPILGPSSRLLEIVEQHKVKDIILAVTHNRKDHLLSEIIKCHQQGIRMYEMPDLYAKMTSKIPIQHINHHWILPNLTAIPNNFYSVFHNATNYIFSLALILFFLPFFPLIMAAIKLDSPGPILYCQNRIGKNGKNFTLFKFRTMDENAEKTGTAWTVKKDPRITKVGNWLRKFRLDELPQLLNVLIGEMALIGPRPEEKSLVETFKKEIPFYEYRYLVLPGITGWAQVNYENTCSLEGAFEKLQYDLFYVKNFSIVLDMVIILKTIRVVLFGLGR